MWLPGGMQGESSDISILSGFGERGLLSLSPVVVAKIPEICAKKMAKMMIVAFMMLNVCVLDNMTEHKTFSYSLSLLFLTSSIRWWFFPVNNGNISVEKVSG